MVTQGLGVQEIRWVINGGTITLENGPSGLTSARGHLCGGPFSSRPQDAQPHVVAGGRLQPHQVIAAELGPHVPGLLPATWAGESAEPQARHR